ncbi:unnamed protein product [Clonostachys rosea]|uniref:Hydrophobin n=1 Tax=Bionectria ochroleuca TaxID=29856 RepID=A0ABY6UFK2_BIOOC|nr:unnamed protein product [Clonostachys rosea]
MFKFIPTLILAASVTALVPQIHPDVIRRADSQKTTVGEARTLCGNKLELQCCNRKIEEKTNETTTNNNTGLLSGLLGDLGLLDDGGIDLLDQCSKLSVTALIGVDDILGSQCRHHVACCDTTAPQTGLINIGLPCIALGGLL